MNAADLARLELAKRAYQAAQPRESEIQTGVRRARLALGRTKPRRAWFSKGLVLVVLAVGSLAYAKPHALGELVEKVLPGGDHGTRSGVGAASLGPAPESTTKPLDVGNARPGAAPPSAIAPATLRDGERTDAGRGSAESANAASADGAGASSRSAATSALEAVANGRIASKKTSASRHAATPAVAPAADSGTPDAAAVSDWGRVGQALARGDEAQALAALSELSESADRRTRDKADVGRA